MESSHHISAIKALETALDGFPSMNVESIETYILAFSLYLSKGDDAYYYHTAFLAEKHANFLKFLQRAREKKTRLDEFIMELRRCEKIEQWKSANLAQASEVRISMDDFYQGTLLADTFLCDEASILGVEQGKNIITVHFHDRIASFFCPRTDSDMENIVEIILSLVTNETTGG